MNPHDCNKLAAEAAPHVETALRAKLESGDHAHLRAVNPAQVATIAGKIVAMLPTILAAAAASGLPLPSGATAAAAFAVDIFAAFSQHFPSVLS